MTSNSVSLTNQRDYEKKDDLGIIIDWNRFKWQTNQVLNAELVWILNKSPIKRHLWDNQGQLNTDGIFDNSNKLILLWIYMWQWFYGYITKWNISFSGMYRNIY